MGLNRRRSRMGTKTCSCQLQGVGRELWSLPGSLLSACSASSGVHDLYTFFSNDRSSKIHNLKTMFLYKRLLWTTAKLRAASASSLWEIFWQQRGPQTAHSQFGLVALPPADGSWDVPSADRSEQGGICWLVELSLCSQDSCL